MVILAIASDQMCKPEDHPGLPADDPLWQLLRRCWNPDPQARPTAAQLIEEVRDKADIDQSLNYVDLCVSSYQQLSKVQGPR